MMRPSDLMDLAAEIESDAIRQQGANVEGSKT